MNWEIKYKKDAWKFISKNKLVDKFEASIKMFIKGEGRIDLKKLAGKLEGYYRLRIGNVRIILKFDFKRKIIFVKKVDFRENIYQ
jgi:mRNA-degrading endonuclease RelE of RelBE toxin-antitoxin system